MEKVKIIAKNTFILIATKALCNVLYFITFIYIARHLGSVDFGKLSFALAFTLILGVFCDFGIKTWMIREVVRNKTQLDLYVFNILFIKSLLAFGTFILISFIIHSLNYSKDVIALVYFLGGAVIINSFTQTGNFLFRAFERMEFEAIVNLFGRAMFLIFTLIAVSMDLNIFYISGSFLVTNLLACSLCWFIFLSRFTLIRFTVNIDLSKKIIKASIPFVLMEIFTEIYFRADAVMLSLMKGDKYVGYYNTAYQFLEGILKMLPLSLMGALFPALAYAFISSEKEFKLLFTKGLRVLIMIGIPLTVGIYILADKFIFFFYGEEYVPSIFVLKVLSLALPFIFINSLLGTSLCTINRQILWTTACGVGMVINILLNFILIPLFAERGAAIATVVTEGTLFFLALFFLYKFIPIPVEYAFLLKTGITSVLMGLLISILKQFNLFVIILAGMTFYFSFLFIIDGFSQGKKVLSKGYLLGKLKQPFL